MKCYVIEVCSKSFSYTVVELSTYEFEGTLVEFLEFVYTESMERNVAVFVIAENELDAIEVVDLCKGTSDYVNLVSSLISAIESGKIDAILMYRTDCGHWILYGGECNSLDKYYREYNVQIHVGMRFDRTVLVAAYEIDEETCNEKEDAVHHAVLYYEELKSLQSLEDLCRALQRKLESQTRLQAS